MVPHARCGGLRVHRGRAGSCSAAGRVGGCRAVPVRRSEEVTTSVTSASPLPPPRTSRRRLAAPLGAGIAEHVHECSFIFGSTLMSGTWSAGQGSCSLVMSSNCSLRFGCTRRSSSVGRRPSPARRTQSTWTSRSSCCGRPTASVDGSICQAVGRRVGRRRTRTWAIRGRRTAAVAARRAGWRTRRSRRATAWASGRRRAGSHESGRGHQQASGGQLEHLVHAAGRATLTRVPLDCKGRLVFRACRSSVVRGEVRGIVLSMADMRAEADPHGS